LKGGSEDPFSTLSTGSITAKIEHEHYVSLKDTEEYLKDPAAWYRKTERSGLDGA